MKDVRMEAVMRAVEARYPRTRAALEPWMDPDGDPDIRCWVHFLNVRSDDMGPLHQFATRIALDLYGPDPKPFVLSIMGRRNTRLYLARRAAEARRERARPRWRGSRGSRRFLRGSRPARARTT